MQPCAHEVETPSHWVVRWAGTIRAGGRVLDVACGQGRHLRYLRSLGFAVAGVDRDGQALAALGALKGVELRVADIEAGPWPFAPGGFDGVVVTNYLPACFPIWSTPATGEC
jgi:SAM-dependent methyltransferase